MRPLHPQGGFTLVELLITVVILGVLAAIAIPNFLNARETAQDGDATYDLRLALQAQQIYHLDHGHYGSSHDQELKDLQPAIRWRFNHDAMNTPGFVHENIPNYSQPKPQHQKVQMGAKSASGACFYVQETRSGADRTTKYATGAENSSGVCTKPSAVTYTTTSW